MKYLAGIIAAAALIGAAVGGTLGVQHFTGGESSDCAELNKTVSSVLVEYHKHPNSVVTKDEWDYLNTVLDVRYKVCHY